MPTESFVPPGAIFASVFQTIEARKQTMPEKSYVAQLLRKGPDAICCKVAEESGETIKAAREQSSDQFIKEVCDLFFHTMVLMAAKDVTFAAVEAEFGRRHGISGLDEKAGRKK
ncbi:MAG TPA: phosphoribosyl-ATP diphosphatase [Planctomycetota bacterium]|nr:phosphoribosyl-ATP diphosphatase [Planctomycetota bacterium]